jgi:hypothetical protein
MYHRHKLLDLICWYLNGISFCGYVYAVSPVLLVHCINESLRNNSQCNYISARLRSQLESRTDLPWFDYMRYYNNINVYRVNAPQLLFPG